jgi:hypothetical protein
MKHLYCRHQQQILPWSTGGAHAYIMHDCGPYKLIIGAHCEFVAIQTQQIALLDTAAELSVAGVEVYQSFADEQASLGLPVGTKTIHTRLGNFEGHLYRVQVQLSADWGEPLTIDGTFLFCEDWQGPTVLGFYGFLERIRLAIDPDYEKIGGIYFAGTD